MRDAPPRNFVAYALRDGQRADQVGSRQHDRELFTAVARCEIARAPGHGPRSVGDRPQRIVTGDVTVAVVVALEVVDVEHQQRERRFLARGRAQFLVETLVQGTTIRKAGQRIDARQSREPRVQARELIDEERGDRQRGEHRVHAREIPAEGEARSREDGEQDIAEQADERNRHP